MCRRGWCLGMVVFALVLTLTPTRTAARDPAQGAARARAQAQPAGVLTLVGQTIWWQPEQPFTLSFDLQVAAPSDMEVAVSVFAPVPHRSRFAQTTQGRLTGRPQSEIPAVTIADLVVNDAGEHTLTFTPPQTREGVYPLRVELRPRGGGTAVDSFVTYLLSVPPVVEGDRLNVASVVPVHAPPATQPDGHVAIDDQQAENLAGMAASLDRHPEVGLTLAPTPETAAALGASPRDEDRATLATLVRALRTRQLLGGPYVPTNLTAMLAAGLEGEAAAQLTQGSQTLNELFGIGPTTSTRLVDERLDESALAFLQAQSVGQVVVPEALLEPIPQNTTLTGTFELESRRGRVRAAMADAGLTPHFAVRNPVAGAIRALADLTVVYFDDPTVERRGIVLAAPRSWQAPADFTDTLLGGLSTSPILAPVSLDGLFASVDATTSRGRPLLRRMAAAAPAPPTLPGSAIRSARRRVEAFSSAVDPDNPLLSRMDRTLLAASSNDLRARERTAYIAGVLEQVQKEIDGIAMPQNRSITLTAREGEIPITVTSALGYPVRATLRIDSDTLDFPDGDERELALVRRNTTSQFVVRARSSGSFPLRVQLVSPQGELILADSRFTVRSTAISGVGTALSIGAGLFLLVWWGNHFRMRRSRRLVPAP